MIGNSLLRNEGTDGGEGNVINRLQQQDDQNRSRQWPKRQPEKCATSRVARPMAIL
jgi:hypothetical protein